jgi:hypothetical protein
MCDISRDGSLRRTLDGRCAALLLLVLIETGKDRQNRAGETYREETATSRASVSEVELSKGPAVEAGFATAGNTALKLW